jgi:riboflavin kinase / FMN adenylyltransferase
MYYEPSACDAGEGPRSVVAGEQRLDPALIMSRTEMSIVNRQGAAQIEHGPSFIDFPKPTPHLLSGSLGIPIIAAGKPLPTPLQNAVVALGNFDGVHRGHQAVVAHASEMARARCAPLVVATFDPHPVRHFKPDTPSFYLTNLAQRQRLLQAANADALLVFGFDDTLAQVDPERFVEDWLSGAGAIVTGADFKFGRGRVGDVKTLAALASERGMLAATVASVCFDGEVVSSSRIREAIRCGKYALATQLLTRPYAVEGVVQAEFGRQQPDGRHSLIIALGDYLSPQPGIYEISTCQLDGNVNFGWGIVPPAACDDSSAKTVELHFSEGSKPREGDVVELAFLRQGTAGNIPDDQSAA